MIVLPQAVRIVMWLLVGGLAVALTYAVFRSYFNAELLIGFANGFVC